MAIHLRLRRFGAWFRFAGILVTLLGTLPRGNTAPRPFPHEQSDLPPDPSARFGALPNGLRYVIYPNAEPRQRASLRLVVLAGSLHEREDERGLAHFVEHLAFNGSTHFAPGTLVEFFQRMGMRFGGDSNANTGLERTVYILELPNTQPGTVEEGMRVLSDYAGGLLFPAESIEKERGIILSERRARETAESRAYQAIRDATLGETLLPRRQPIGRAATIQEAPRERLVDFWNAWYRPERLVVVAVGDFSPAEMRAQISRWLSPLQPRGPARPEPAIGAPVAFTGLRSIYLPDPEASATTVTLLSYRPLSPELDTVARRRAGYTRNLAINMLSGRFGGIARGANAPISRGLARSSDTVNALQESAVQLTCKPEQWRNALTIAEVELRRALEFGFTAYELKTAVAVLTNSITQGVNGAATRSSRVIADGIAASLVNERVWLAPADIATVLRPELESVSLEDCQAALRVAFDSNGRYAVVSGNVSNLANPSATIAAQYAAAQKVPVKARTERVETPWAYAAAGPAGEIVRREHVPDLDLTLVTFANGVRLNLKATDFEAGRVRFTARVGYGALSEPADQPGLGILASNVFVSAGLGKHSYNEQRHVFAGRDVNVGFSAPPTDAFVLGGVTNREHLPASLELLAAYLMDAGYRGEALGPVHRSLEQLYTRLENTPTGPFSTLVARTIAGNDSRFGLPPREVLLRRTLAELRAWLDPQLKGGPLEVSLIGDLDIEATIRVCAVVLGALPPRAPREEKPDQRRTAFPNQPFQATLAIYSDIPKGIVAGYWPVASGDDRLQQRRIGMLATVLHDELRSRVREELGATYSPSTRTYLNRDLPQAGYLTTQVDIDPANAARILRVVTEVADRLAQGGLTPDQLLRAREPALTAARDLQRNNQHWLGAVLARAQQNPETLDWARTYVTDLQQITVDDLNALARQCLPRPRISTVTVLPKAVVTKPTANIPIAQFAGPDRTFRDPQFQVTGRLPETWEIRSIRRVENQGTMISFSVPAHPKLVPTLTYRFLPASPVKSDQSAEDWLRRQLGAKGDLRRKMDRLADYRTRPESLEFRLRDNVPTLSSVSDFTQGTAARCEHTLQIVGGAACGDLLLIGTEEEVHALRPAMQQLMDSVQLPAPTAKPSRPSPPPPPAPELP